MLTTYYYKFLLSYSFISLTTCQLSPSQTLQNTWKRFTDQTKLIFPHITSKLNPVQLQHSQHCQANHQKSDILVPSTRYDYKNPTHWPVNKSSDVFIWNGFVEQACYPSPSADDDDDEELCIFFNSDFNGGRGLSVLMQISSFLDLFRYHTVLEEGSGVYTKPDRESNPWEPFQLSKKHNHNSNGIRATQDLKVEDLIFFRHPLLLIAGAHSGPDDVWGKILQHMVDILPIESRKRISKMRAFGNTTSDWLRSAYSLNAYNLGNGPDNLGLIGIIPEASKFNHDCRPNVAWHFGGPTLEFRMHPLRKIKRGEELTVSYGPVLAEWKDRQEYLRDTFNISCTCSRCQASFEQRKFDDDQIKHALKLREHLSDWNTLPKTSPILKDAEEFIKIIRTQHLDLELPTAYYFASIAYNGFGNMKKAIHYARLSLDKSIYIHGYEWIFNFEAEIVKFFPETHWSYLRYISSSSSENLTITSEQRN